MQFFLISLTYILNSSGPNAEAWGTPKAKKYLLLQNMTANFHENGVSHSVLAEVPERNDAPGESHVRSLGKRMTAGKI